MKQLVKYFAIGCLIGVPLAGIGLTIITNHRTIKTERLVVICDSVTWVRDINAGLDNAHSALCTLNDVYGPTVIVTRID